MQHSTLDSLAFGNRGTLQELHHINCAGGCEVLIPGDGANQIKVIPLQNRQLTGESVVVKRLVVGGGGDVRSYVTLPVQWCIQHVDHAADHSGIIDATKLIGGGQQ